MLAKVKLVMSKMMVCFSQDCPSAVVGGTYRSLNRGNEHQPSRFNGEHRESLQNLIALIR